MPVYPGSSFPSSNGTSLAASSPTALRACAAPPVATRCWSPFPARAAASVLPAPRVACRGPRRTSSTACSLTCPCASGSSRSHVGRAFFSPGIHGSSPAHSTLPCARSSASSVAAPVAPERSRRARVRSPSCIMPSPRLCGVERAAACCRVTLSLGRQGYAHRVRPCRTPHNRGALWLLATWRAQGDPCSAPASKRPSHSLAPVPGNSAFTSTPSRRRLAKPVTDLTPSAHSSVRPRTSAAGQSGLVSLSRHSTRAPFGGSSATSPSASAREGERACRGVRSGARSCSSPTFAVAASSRQPSRIRQRASGMRRSGFACG